MNDINQLFSLLNSFDNKLFTLVSTYPREDEKSYPYPKEVEKGFLLVYPNLRSKLNAVVHDCLVGNLCSL